MRKKNLLLGMLSLLLGGTQACNKESMLGPIPTIATPEVTNQLQATFAKTLGKALKSDPELRSFLKTESLKMFDNDYDVLYQMVKDNPIANGETFRQRLLRFISADELTAIERQVPLLTIFVPSLPSGFSAETWQVIQQIPKVAIRQVDNPIVPLYDDSGMETIVKPDHIPAFPVVVIKQNERVIAGSSVTGGQEESLQPFYQSQYFSFRFLASAYDGMHSLNKEVTRNVHAPVVANTGDGSQAITNRYTGSPYNVSTTYATSQRNIEAYNIGVANPNFEWQRDYVYYGITPANTKGPLKTNFRETIRALRLSNDGIARMAGQAGDPGAPTKGSASYGTGYWLDGFYEFLIVVLNNPKDGAPPQTPIRFSVRPADIYTIKYNRIFANNDPEYDVITKVYPKEYLVNIPVAAWDLANFGTAWSYHIFEENMTVDHTEQETITTTYAANFEFDPTLTGFVKGGAKFGASATTTNSKVVTLHYTTGATDLGEKISYFYDPIIISQGANTGDPLSGINIGSNGYNTFDLAPGGSAGYAFLSVEPYSVIASENQ